MAERATRSIGDQAERERALAAETSFIVQAPAGSGKTELLIQRFLRLLAVATRPEAVVALTFTRKAASEMRERVLSALLDVAAGKPTAGDHEKTRRRLALAVLERSRDQGWDLLTSPHRLEITTIDALCARLTASMPLLTRLGGSPSVVEDPFPLYREAARRALAQADYDASKRAQLRILLARREMRVARVEDQIVAMLAKRDQWTRDALAARSDVEARKLLERVESGIEQAMGESVMAVARLFDAAENDLVHRLACATRASLRDKGQTCPWPTLGDGDRLGADLSSIPAWKQARALLVTASNPRKIRSESRFPGANKGSDGSALWIELHESLTERSARRQEELLAALLAMDSVPERAAYAQESREAMLALFELLVAAHAELWLLFRERRCADFIEIAARAIEALGSVDRPSDLLETLDRRVEHLLVDEFQDTSVMQCELVRRLTAGWHRGDGRTLFLVGDPMQSIYRFRKAEVGLFLEARSERGLFDNIKLEPLRLSVNFRSQPKIIEWVNTRFAELLGDVEDATTGSVAYAASQPPPGSTDGPVPELVFWSPGAHENGAAEKPSARTAHAAEAAGVARLIAGELLPQARGRGGSVAVLARARSHVAALLAELRARGVAYRTEGLDSLRDRSAIQDLRSLTRFLLHRGDRLSGLALLRGPLVGLKLADLAVLVEPDVVRSAGLDPGDPSRPEAQRSALASITSLLENVAAGTISQDGLRRLQRVTAILKTARAELGRRRLTELVEGAWIALGGPHVAGEGGTRDAQAFFGLLGSIERAGHVDGAELDRGLARLSAPVDPDPDIAVRVMTMHAAKGLEFDTVLIVATGRATNASSSEPIVFETDPRTGAMSAMGLEKARGRDHEDDLKHKLITLRERERDRAETLRLLYVGSTRAKHRLLFSASEPSCGKDGGYNAPSRDTLLGSLARALDLDTVELREPPAERASAAHPSPRLRSDVEPMAIPATARVRRRYERRPSEAGEEDPVAFEQLASLARNAGVVAHACFEKVAREGAAAWPTARVESERPAIRRRLMQLGTPPAELEEAENLVVRALVTTLADEVGRWILQAHDRARSEWKLTHWNPRALSSVDVTNASIDRAFIDRDVRWIVDYKVVEPAAGEDLATFLQRKHAQYREQLESYAELVRGLEPQRSIELGLYFPLLGRAVWWPAGAESWREQP